MIYDDLPEKIKARVKIRNDCWIWDGPVNSSGVPVFNWQGKKGVTVRRVVYSMYLGSGSFGQLKTLCEQRCLYPLHCKPPVDKDGNMTCYDCGQTKNKDMFCKSSATSNGYVSWCLDCRSAYSANDWAVNRQARSESFKRWAGQNREYNNERKRRWEAENLDHVINYRQEYSKIYRENNRELIRFLNNRRAKRERSAEGMHSFTEWTSLLNATHNMCLACGRDDIALTRDHIVPLSLGGTNWISNIQPLCGVCNSKKGTKIIDYRPEDLR